MWGFILVIQDSTDILLQQKCFKHRKLVGQVRAEKQGEFIEETACKMCITPDGVVFVYSGYLDDSKCSPAPRISAWYMTRSLPSLLACIQLPRARAGAGICPSNQR